MNAYKTKKIKRERKRPEYAKDQRFKQKPYYHQLE